MIFLSYLLSKLHIINQKIFFYTSLEFLNFSANQNIFTNDESSMSPKVGVAKVQPAGTVTIIHTLPDNFSAGRNTKILLAKKI